MECGYNNISLYITIYILLQLDTVKMIKEVMHD